MAPRPSEICEDRDVKRRYSPKIEPAACNVTRPPLHPVLQRVVYKGTSTLIFKAQIPSHSTSATKGTQTIFNGDTLEHVDSASRNFEKQSVVDFDDDDDGNDDVVNADDADDDDGGNEEG